LKAYLFKFLNNSIFNAILIQFKLDRVLLKLHHGWRDLEYDQDRSIESNMGFSMPEVQSKYLPAIKSDLKHFVQNQLEKESQILDLGCGAGFYLREFEGVYGLNGLDINPSFIKEAKRRIPSATFFTTDFLSFETDQRFNLIYSISVIEYVPPSALRSFFQKLWQLTEDEGFIYIQYPHAIKQGDLKYPDLSYNRYSPNHIEMTASEFFDVQRHKHSFEEKSVENFDANPMRADLENFFGNGYTYIGKRCK